MTPPSDAAGPLSLAGLGWSDFFEAQLEPGEIDLAAARIANVHRARLTALSPSGRIEFTLPVQVDATDFAVGDWVLLNAQSHRFHRRLERRTLLQRRPDGRGRPQITGANIDTLFIVTSCNADFSPARLERYLALANESGTRPVIVLTKVDTAGDAQSYVQQARALQRGLDVVTVDARSGGAAAALAPWCGWGRTVALTGSSGVGKSTLVNTLAAAGDDNLQLTGGVRESDSKGRHTTTSRSLHAIAGGGWIIDTPGIRTLHVSGVGSGLDTLFAEITELAPLCKFRDCTHVHEPGCAVLAAEAAGTLPPERLARWRKLQDENRSNSPRPNRR